MFVSLAFCNLKYFQYVQANTKVDNQWLKGQSLASRKGKILQAEQDLQLLGVYIEEILRWKVDIDFLCDMYFRTKSREENGLLNGVSTLYVLVYLFVSGKVRPGDMDHNYGMIHYAVCRVWSY